MEGTRIQYTVTPNDLQCKCMFSTPFPHLWHNTTNVVCGYRVPAELNREQYSSLFCLQIKADIISTSCRTDKWISSQLSLVSCIRIEW